MIVMKFGGTSVEDAPSMKRVTEIVRSRLQLKPVVVASACAGVTNDLLDVAQSALRQPRSRPFEIIDRLRKRHVEIAGALFAGDLLATVTLQLDAFFDELRDLTRSIAILGELTDRSLDTFASFGEKLSTLILSYLFKCEGINSVLVSAQDVIITSDDFTNAIPREEETRNRVREVILPKIQSGQVVVTQGFLGATASGVPTTIGRGGSDYTAALIGAALPADEIQIWTDVDGMMTSDPRLIPGAQMIDEMSFDEAAELAYFGARVLHPATILPAVRKNIPVRVLNSRSPGVQGTVIVSSRGRPRENDATAIAHKEGITLIKIESTRMLMTHGFLARVFEVFARYGKSVDVIATSEVSISLTVDNDRDLEGIFPELRSIAEVTAESGKAIVCLVGDKLRKSRGAMARIFTALESAEIHVDMVSVGASEINVTFVVADADARSAVRALHAEFFPGEE